MKKHFLPLIAALIFLGSCKEDFEVSAPYKDITVVYGILNKKDIAHYIRIEKAFLDEKKSAIDMSKVPDSSFYNNLTVTMQEVKGSTLTTIPLDLVDLDTVKGYEKQAGEFFTSPNWAYKFTNTLSADANYRLLIKNNNTGRTDSSELLGIVNSDSIRSTPGNFYLNDSRIYSSSYVIEFARTNDAYKYQLFGNTPKNGKLLEGHIIFNYIDSNVITGVLVKKSLDYLFATDTREPNTQFTLEVQNKLIYSFLIDAMGSAPANIVRLMDSCDLLIYSGSYELYKYQQTVSGQNAGLTGEQIKPSYTNMKGTNSLGLLGSRAYVRYTNIGIEGITLDSLKANPLTKPLNIKGRTSN
jgi:hypothetical protein